MCILFKLKAGRMKNCYVLGNSNLINNWQNRFNNCAFSLSDPNQWVEEDVKAWILWTVRQFSLPMINTDCFNIDGATLCQLTEEDFQQRSPQVSVSN